MRTQTLSKLFAIIIAVIMCVSVFSACAEDDTTADENEAKYQEAFDKLEAGDYEAAYALFTELGDYKDAAKEAAYFRFIPVSHYIEYTSDDENGTITYTVTLNDQNLPATILEEYSDGFKNTCTYTYNEFGFVTRRECSDTDGNTSSYEATYDARGNMLSATRVYEDGTVGTFECTYNEKDELVKVVTNNAPHYYDSYTSIYDAEGREIKVIYDYAGEISIEETTYNEAGDLLKKTWSEKDGEVYSISDYIYDEKGRLAEIRITDNGEDDGFRKNTYNDKDQLITEHVSYPFDDYEHTNNYEYDEHGNAVKITYTRSSNTDGAYHDVTESTYKLVYLPFDYTEEEWTDICDSTQCWDSTHW